MGIQIQDVLVILQSLQCMGIQDVLSMTRCLESVPAVPE